MKKKILYLGNKLAAKGYTPTGIDTLGLALESEGYQVKYASSRQAKVLRAGEIILALFKYRNWADYVLIDTYSTQNFWVAYGAARLCGFFNIKYLPILHGGNLPARIKRNPKASDAIFRNSYLNCAPSLYLKNAFKKAGFNNVTLTPNALDLKSYPFKLIEQVQPKLLWVRSFASIYNPMLAVKLIEALLPKYPDVELCMVGPDKDGTGKICKSYAKEHDLPISFPGKLSKSDWTSLASGYDIFINTTHYDNTPVSVLEAMALGLPVISTSVGGIPDLMIHKKTGVLVEDDNLSQFIEAVDYLINNSKNTRQIAEDSRCYIEDYDWGKVKVLWDNILV